MQMYHNLLLNSIIFLHNIAITQHKKNLRFMAEVLAE